MTPGPSSGRLSGALAAARERAGLLAGFGGGGGPGGSFGGGGGLAPPPTPPLLLGSARPSPRRTRPSTAAGNGLRGRHRALRPARQARRRGGQARGGRGQVPGRGGPARGDRPEEGEGHDYRLCGRGRVRVLYVPVLAEEVNCEGERARECNRETEFFSPSSKSHLQCCSPLVGFCSLLLPPLLSSSRVRASSIRSSLVELLFP